MDTCWHHQKMGTVCSISFALNVVIEGVGYVKLTVLLKGWCTKTAMCVVINLTLFFVNGRSM